MEVHEVYPYPRVRSTADAIAFYTKAFDAKEQFDSPNPAVALATPKSKSDLIR